MGGEAGEEYGEGRVMVPKSVEVADDSGCISLLMRSVDMYTRPVCVALEAAQVANEVFPQAGVSAVSRRRPSSKAASVER
jgi:hypothetical protein